MQPCPLSQTANWDTWAIYLIDGSMSANHKTWFHTEYISVNLWWCSRNRIRLLTEANGFNSHWSCSELPCTTSDILEHTTGIYLFHSGWRGTSNTHGSLCYVLSLWVSQNNRILQHCFQNCRDLGKYKPVITAFSSICSLFHGYFVIQLSKRMDQNINCMEWRNSSENYLNKWRGPGCGALIGMPYLKGS